MGRTTRILILGLVLAGFLVVPKALTPPAHSEAGCGPVSGPYGLSGSGTIFGIPASFVGELVFDGQGKAAGSIVLNAGGSIDQITGMVGQYKLNSCTGTLTIQTVHHNPPVTHWHDFHLSVVDGGKEILYEAGGPKDSPTASPPPGEILIGVMKRQ